MIILHVAKSFLWKNFLLVNTSALNLVHGECDFPASYLRSLVNWSNRGWAIYATKYRKGEIPQEMNVDSYLHLLPLSLKCKISAIWLVETACIFLIFLIATVQISMECETYICRYNINQHLIALKLDSFSINKSTAPEFVTVKVSQGLNLM